MERKHLPGINQFEGHREQKGGIQNTRLEGTALLQSPAFTSIRTRLHERSLSLSRDLESKLPKLIVGWAILMLLASALRIAMSPTADLDQTAVTPYVLLTFAPVISFILALRWFANGHTHPQPQWRLSFVGSWRGVSAAEAMSHPLYGTSGFMVSLLLGILINLPIRAAEYFVIMPAISAGVPDWIIVLNIAMTVDVVVMSSLYVVAFVAALRRVPLFPRLLLFVWLLDIVMQLMIAEAAAATTLPAGVAGALQPLLDSNIKKTLISVGVWLPYLLLSSRVNVTYRQRVPA